MADTRAVTKIWKGLNRMPYIGDGEMRDMQNLSSDAYPFITTRKGRKPYKFQISIPGTVENGGYEADVTELPTELGENDQGKIYKLTGEFEAGVFYKYDGEKWVKDESVEVVSEVIKSGRDCYTLLNSYCATHLHERVYASKLTEEIKAEEHIGTTVKYIGDTTVKYIGATNDFFEKNKVYVYSIVRRYDWKKTETNAGLDKTVAELPEASEDYLGKKYKVNDEYYKCYRYWQGIWKETEDYPSVSQEPESPQEGNYIFWCGATTVTKGEFYACVEDSGKYYHLKTTPSSDAKEVDALPEPDSDNVGKVYKYTGASTGGYMQWAYEDNDYKWKEVEAPKVYKMVTLAEYLNKYTSRGLNKILEIGSFRGNMVALIEDGNGNNKLYYNKKVWSVKNVTNEAGRKLITVGNKLIVGESGSYLYLKQTKDSDGVVDRNIYLFASGAAFSCEVSVSDFAWGNGGDKYKIYKAYGNKDGNSTFLIYSPAGKGNKLKTIADGLSGVNAGFSVYSKREGKIHEQYLKATSVSFEEHKLIGGWTTGTIWYEDYADVLEIRAEGAWEDFDWHSEAGDTLVFASTDSHYYDVTAWKKRLWGYYDNVMCGTAADIFDKEGKIDWISGTNTNMEPVTQPLWQGGDITGIAALMNALVYFKEDCITVVQGNYPAIMSSSTIPCRGLPPENRRSVAVANESVYYLSTDGVYRFDGGIPRCISREVKITGTDAVGASDGNKYYISLKEKNGEYALYVYDINYDVWHKEDNIRATSFVMLGGEMYMASGTEIFNISADKDEVPWMCELWYDEGTNARKKYKELNIRGNVGDYELFVKTDNGEMRYIAAKEAAVNPVTKFPPIECQEITITLRGKGTPEIKSIERVFEVM